MRTRIALLAVLAVVVAACGGDDAETSTSPPEASSTIAPTTTTIAPTTTTIAPTTTTIAPTTTTIAPTTTTEPPPQLFDGEFRMVLGTGPNEWESQFMDPGGVVQDGDTLYMFYNGIDAWPAEVRVGLATSTDGIAWTRSSDDWVTTAEGVGWVPVTMFISSAVILDDGTWALYFYTVESLGVSAGSEVGMITAPGPDGPWTFSEGPVLTGGPEGAWDEKAATHPSVLKVGEEWWMYYDGNRGDIASDGDRGIGLATSSDGYTWTKYDDPATAEAPYAESDPVLTAGSGDDWDANRVYDGNVIRIGDGFVMGYLTHRPDPRNARVDYVFGLATSDDGISWVKHPENPLLSSSRWGFQGVYLSTMVHAFDSYLWFFDVQSSSSGTTSVWVMEHEGEMLP